MSKSKFTIVLFSLIIHSCGQINNASTSSDQNTTDDQVTTLEQTMHSYALAPEDTTTQKNDTCNCDWSDKNLSHYTDLTFSNNGSPFHLDSLAKWIGNPKRLEVHSLRLIDFDTLPVEMGIFENVESVYLEAINNKNVQGLEIFPKLTNVKAEEEKFEFGEETEWIKNIQILQANKTKISGLRSFKQIPNLRVVELSFSGFDHFPSDFTSLKCLSYFHSGAHTFCKIDLSQLNLSEMTCLNYVNFQSWSDNLSGIPTGIEHVEKVEISHPNLTQTEQEKLNKIRK